MTPIRFRHGEFPFIDWIRSQTPESEAPLLVGPGDDACVLDLGKDPRVAATTDMLLEGTHFDLRDVTPAQLGWKSAGVSLSDVAAMAMEPVALLAAVGLPDSRGRKFAEGLYRGMRELADRFRVTIAGGDVTSWRRPLTVICVTALGRCVGAEPVLRSGARPGDAIVVTGELGGSLLGRHARFMPRVKEAQAIARGYSPHAMIDISDGLAIDLHHILEESGVGARVEAARIPVSEDARRLGMTSGRSPLDHALGDGEDFELLFTLAEADAARLLRDRPFETPVTRIGTITPAGAVLLLPDGTERPLERHGWEHTTSQNQEFHHG
jgi:thiamine-monophosphate kinase